MANFTSICYDYGLWICGRLGWICVVNGEEFLSIVDGKLRDDKDDTESTAMGRNIMPPRLTQTTPVLEPFVDGFLLASDSLLHFQIVCWIAESSWALDKLRIFATVAIISLDPLIGVEV